MNKKIIFILSFLVIALVLNTVTLNTTNARSIINESNNSAEKKMSLEQAVRKNNYKQVQYILKIGVDPANYNNNLLLDIAIGNNNISIVTLLLNYGADPNAYINNNQGLFITPLIKAIEQQDIAMVTILLNHKANINTPSVYSEDKTVFNFEDQLNNTGPSPLIVAVTGSANIDSDSTNINTSSSRGVNNYAIFSLLMNKKPAINYQTSKGFNALMATAVGYNSIYQIEIKCSMARDLLKKGIALETTDKNSKTALDHAKDNQFSKMIDLLEKATKNK